jgi:hypothetical protein
MLKDETRYDYPENIIINQVGIEETSSQMSI